MLIIRFDPEGNVLWLRQFDWDNMDVPSPGDVMHAPGNSAVLRPDGGLFVTGFQRNNIDWGNDFTTITGTTSSNVFLWGVDENGVTDFTTVSEPTSNGSEAVAMFHGNQENEYFLYVSAREEFDFMGESLVLDDEESVLLKFNLSSVNIEENRKTLISHFPDPASEWLSFKGIDERMDLELFDMSGRLIISDIIQPDNPVLNLNGLSKGTYFIHLKGEEKNYTESLRILQ